MVENHVRGNHSVQLTCHSNFVKLFPLFYRCKAFLTNIYYTISRHVNEYPVGDLVCLQVMKINLTETEMCRYWRGLSVMGYLNLIFRDIQWVTMENIHSHSWMCVLLSQSICYPVWLHMKSFVRYVIHVRVIFAP